jgi:ABC-type branched-subunit amino acid transport system substrate-binding protein
VGDRPHRSLAGPLAGGEEREGSYARISAGTRAWDTPRNQSRWTDVMSLEMKIRLWARQAPRSHVVIGVVVVVAALAGLVVIAVPQDANVDGPSFGASVLDGGAITTAPAGDLNISDVEGVPADAPAEGGSGAASVLQGGSGDGSSTPAGEQAQTSAVESAEEGRVSSDQGVSADTVKIGFVAPDLGGAGAGYALGAGFLDAEELERIWQALVGWANDSGGVHGRAIEYVTATQDPLNSNSQRAACIAMAQDAKVFSVIEAGSTIGVTSMCYAEHALPFFYGSPQTTSESLFQKANGYLVSSGSTGSRVLRNWAAMALDDGFLKRGEGKLGIVNSECAPDPEMYDQVLKPLLKENGISFVEARLSCDVVTAQQQIPGAILRFRQEGVDRVLMAVIYITVQNFLQQADSQQWRPAKGYGCSDMYGQCRTLYTENYSRQQWEGTRGYTYSWSGIDDPSSYSDEIKACSKIYEDAGMEPLDDINDTDTAHLTYCTHFKIWLESARRSPVNLTRKDVVSAVQQLGDFPVAFSHRAVFGPGKTNGGDSYAVVEWRTDCGCYRQLRAHQNARY